ncbi:hypothetical protein JF542_17455 [Salipiger bermudensis]|nr:hypothetical protein [Salipiger bermudensis]
MGDDGVHNLRATRGAPVGALVRTKRRFTLENAFDLDYSSHLASRKAPGRTVMVSLSKLF